MITIDSILDIGFEHDKSKDMGGFNPSHMDDVTCFYLDLTDKNTNSNFRFEKTFAYLMLTIDGVVRLEIDETTVAQEVYIKDTGKMIQLLEMHGIIVNENSKLKS